MATQALKRQMSPTIATSWLMQTRPYTFALVAAVKSPLSSSLEHVENCSSSANSPKSSRTQTGLVQRQLAYGLRLRVIIFMGNPSAPGASSTTNSIQMPIIDFEIDLDERDGTRLGEARIYIDASLLK